jgi:glycine/D-amino acid oxidase-like deaminating enzyme
MKDYSDKSFWLATYGEYVPNSPLQGDLSIDVAIIGAGFTCLSTAYNLRKADRGISVAVLEAEVVGFGASGRNGGFSMTLFGLEPAITKAVFRHHRTMEANKNGENDEVTRSF